jgi:hypothetical protein
LVNFCKILYFYKNALDFVDPSPNFSFLPYPTTANAKLVRFTPLHKSLKIALPACHKWPSKNKNKKVE